MSSLLSHICPQQPGLKSPKKKCTKRKAANIDLKAAKPKRTRAQHSVVPPPSVTASTVDESQQTRRSGCLGAGKGDRNIQLERLDAILDAPARTSQPKGSNSLDSNIPANPAASELPHKDCGSCSKKKQPPPPYNISEQPILNTMMINTPIPNAPIFNTTIPNTTIPNTTIPNAKIPRARPKTKTVAPPLSMESGSNKPTFLQCEDGGRFGFSQPIVPPGTEPDLQMLNNSFIAAAKETHVASDALQHHFPIITSNPSGSCLASGGDLSQPVFLRMTSTTAADTLFYQNLDPTLRPTGPQSTASECSDSGKGDSSESSDNDDEDEQIGWGAVGGHCTKHLSASLTIGYFDGIWHQCTFHPFPAMPNITRTRPDDNPIPRTLGPATFPRFGLSLCPVRSHASPLRHSAHPGFSGEEQPSQPRVVSPRPPDFQFQFSCDEDDQMAEKALSVGTGLSDSSASADDRIAPKPDDVLNLRHQKNGHPQMPNPELLDLFRRAETNTSNTKVNMQAVKVTAKSKVSEGSNATQLGWYGPRWKSFLEDAKVECRAQQALDNPFPKLEDLPYTVTESLSVSLIQWLKNGGQVEADVWPAHKSDMSRLLYDDSATWCSDLKKITIAITPSVYSLVPPATIPVQERAAWVQNAAMDWLDDSLFLHDGVDKLGKTRNFAHPGLHEATILFLHTGSYCIARRRPEIFRKEIPLTCFTLVCTTFNCVFNGLIKNGNGKSFLNFTAKKYKPIYLTMLQLLCEVMEDPYHGPRLVLQLHARAEAGWAKSCKLDGIDPSKCCHLRIQLD
ncbi:hypothetical protein DEU56DRAFT_905855 [Suillus clintonianus]|uniref:uncharacterized protein n=1 Tax=Suillus clintonianus TaxID=1904413 RepID=UPI001B8649C1|nr:uncharacterized protein DEU56DRAFT_905855 [Suillus clintonianus]KAG2157191.1 hypothetical protein DEU56DRAFT_905855 [Suillus clintonianus]